VPQFILERKIRGFWQAPFSASQGAGQASCGVLREIRPEIHLVESYVSGDKVFCVYRAPNEEIMREYAELGGFRANCVSKVERMYDLTTEQRLRPLQRRADTAFVAPSLRSGTSTGKT
jgi:hypothetical protein